MRPLLWAARGFQQLAQVGSGASANDHTVTEVTSAARPRPLSPQLEGEGSRLFRHSLPLSPTLLPGLQWERLMSLWKLLTPWQQHPCNRKHSFLFVCWPWHAEFPQPGIEPMGPTVENTES